MADSPETSQGVGNESTGGTDSNEIPRTRLEDEYFRLECIGREQIIPDPKKVKIDTVAGKVVYPPLHQELAEAFEEYAITKTSHSAFILERQAWRHLAGEKSRFWIDGIGLVAKTRSENGALYEKLSVEKRMIRLMQVSRLANPQDILNRGAEFEVQLITVSLDDYPSYLAISYTWGDPTVVGHFGSLHNRPALGYNEGVFNIINTLVGPGNTLYLWIDALCINQQDFQERANQVSMMREIYSKARQVVVYLGPPDDDTEAAMDLLQVGPDIVGVKQWNDTSIDEMDELIEAGEAKGMTVRNWLSLGRLLDMRWFKRCWVIQEFALGTSPVFVWGSHAVDWFKFQATCFSLVRCKQLLRAILILKEMEQDLASLKEATFTHFFQLQMYRRMVQSKKPPRLQILLGYINRNFMANDPRDRVFALLGIAGEFDIEDPGLQPDYTVSTEKLFTRTARHLLIRDDKLSLLESAGSGFPKELQLPSWVPDWTSMPDLVPLSFLRDEKDVDASSGTKSVVQRGSQDAELMINGVIIDTISKISSCNFNDATGDIVDILSWIQELVELGDSIPLAYDQETREDAFWKTLVAFANPSEHPRNNQAMCLLTFSSWLYTMENPADIEDSSWQREDIAYHLTVCRAYIVATRKRRFFITDAGHFGLAHRGTKVGDMVCVFLGGSLPYVIRERPESSTELKRYELVGQAYHYGIMANPPNLDNATPICLI
jgi:hypothetical protein